VWGWACLWVCVFVCARVYVHQPPTAHSQPATAAGMCKSGLVCVYVCVGVGVCISLPLLTASPLQQQVLVWVGLYVGVGVRVCVRVCASASHCSQPVCYSSRYV